MAVTLGADVLSRYERFSLYNSPYPAHDEGCAIDCYPGTLDDGRTTAAPSPVGGEVLATRTVRAPPKPYAPDHDHLIVVDCDDPASVTDHVARILHVDPAVEAGDRVAVGDDLGTLVRAGFFAPWVDNHLHVGFRTAGQNPYRASGSVRIDLGIAVRPLAWDGTGTVAATGETYAVLDSPAHPDPGEEFVGVRADGGEPSSEERSSSGRSSEQSPREDEARRSSSARRSDGGGVLDGGLPHYDGGGLLGGADGPVRLVGERIGVADGRNVTWDDVVVTANGDPVTGLSLFCARDAGFGAKVICPERSFAIGDRVRVGVRPA